LLHEGHAVAGVDNFITGNAANIEHLRNHPKWEFHEIDVTRAFEIGGNVQAVMHAASLASPRDYLARPLETLEAGSSGTRNMLELARRHQASFLLTSTSECYGDPLQHPQSEDYWGNVNPVGPRSCYDESKRYAEALTMAFHRVHGVNTSIARIFNTYGPRMQLRDGRVVPEFIHQALTGEPLTVFGDGQQTRSFCYVSDLVRGLVALSRSGEPYPVNLGNPREMTILEFAEIIQKIVGLTSAIDYRPLPQDDPKRRQPDITRARMLLDWEPATAIEEGLKETIEYFRPRVNLTAARTAPTL